LWRNWNQHCQEGNSNN